MLDAALASPVSYLLAFLAASAVMVVAVDDMARQGLQGTVVGTLVMPLCSGAPNLIFAVTMALNRGPGSEVLVNALVNNVTNLTLLIGLPGLIWGLVIIPRKRVAKRKKQDHSLSRLSLALTLLAVIFFTGITWALGRDGALTFGDGLTLVAVFFFWQSFELYDVLRSNIENGRVLGWRILLDVVAVAAGALVMFHSIDWMVRWISAIEEGFISVRYMGWLSGWLMVLPNAVPAFYYAARKRADIAYSSQVGDAHICIPLCIGLFALFRTIRTPAFFTVGMIALAAAAATHLILVGTLGRLPRPVAAVFLIAYGVFLYVGLAG